MEFGEIFSNALKYPISDYKRLLILGVICLVINIPVVLTQFNYVNASLFLVWTLVAIILGLLILGYSLSIMKKGIDLEDEIPDIDFTKNLVDGIKSFVVTFIYYLIPTIIVSIIGITSLASFLGSIDKNAISTATNATTPNTILSAIPNEAWAGLITGLTITAIVAIILFIIFGIFETIALCRLADTGSLGEAFAISAIIDDIKEIGFLKLIGVLIVLIIISVIIGMVIGIISAIPYVGLIIGFLVGNSFLLLFYNRALGLLYSEV